MATNMFMPYTGQAAGGDDYYKTLTRLARQPSQGAWQTGGGSSWGAGFGDATPGSTRPTPPQSDPAYSPLATPRPVAEPVGTMAPGIPVSQTGRGWRHINESDAISYNQHPQQAFLQFATDTFGANTPGYQWAQGQFPRLWADYFRQTENGREDLSFTDYLTRQLQMQMRGEFANQNSRDRGVNPAAWGPRVAW